MSQWKWTFTWIPRAGWIRLWPASMTRLAISLKLPLRISKFDLEWGDDLAMLRNHKHNFQLDFLFCVFFFFSKRNEHREITEKNESIRNVCWELTRFLIIFVSCVLT